MVKSKKPKLKQKQSQSQSVVVNIGTPRRKKVLQQQPTQKNSIASTAAIPPYLGLQSANNAQLLNSFQTTLTQ